MKNLGNVIDGKDVTTKEYVDDNTKILVKAPVGSIVIWSGTADDIPTGWHLCDGTNGTPDLRDKFVLGAGNEHGVGSKGGSEEVKLTSTQIPTHNHTLSGYNTGGNAGPGVDQYGSLIKSTNGGNFTVENSNIMNRILFKTSNALGYPTNTSLVSAHENMPPYYTLCYIMKLTADYTDISSGEVYSTEETRIGTWIDGKPLYRKVVIGTTPSQTSSTATTFAILDNSLNVVKLYGYFYHAGTDIAPIPTCEYYSSTSVRTIHSYVTQHKILMDTSFSGWTGKQAYMIIEYTKTTDT